MNRDYLKYFPKESPYPNQDRAMDDLYRALSDRHIVLFEGACGTGKTLSALVPSLHIAQQNDKTVVIATNVHQQMLQFIDEAKEIRRIADIKVIVLKGKLHMCPVEKNYEECDVSRENTYELIKLEQNMNQSYANDMRIRTLKKRSCGHLLQTLKGDNVEFYEWLFSGVRTPEEVEAWASNDGTCGYELLKREMYNADLVICNYHHLLNPDILTKFLSWIGRGPEDIIAIFDEAHNIESAARLHSSLTLTEYTIEQALNELRDTGAHEDAVEKLLRALRDALRETYESKFAFGEKERIGVEWHDVSIREPSGTEDLLSVNLHRRLLDADVLVERAHTLGSEFDAIYCNQYKEGLSETKKSSHLIAVSTFLENYLRLAGDPGYYPLINIRRGQGGEITGRIELFSCIPKNVTMSLFNSFYSAILMSATLRPFDVVKTTLGIDRDVSKIAYGSPFPRNRRHTIAVTAPPLFARNRDDQEVIDAITRVLKDIIEQSDGNVLIFFPNFSEAARYYDLLVSNLQDLSISVPMFLDRVGVSAMDVMEEFLKIGKSGGKAVLLSYLWGTLTEGIDYKDGRARTVVIVGVGYPALSDKTRAIQYSYDYEFGAGKGWRYAIETPMIRKVRQAMGRVIRSPEDYGVRILLDVRYTSESTKTMGKYSIYPRLPPDEREEIIDVAPEKVKYALMNFFNDIKQKSA